MGICWICGSPATSAEHKIKKSDLTRVHGRGKEFVQANLNYLRGDDSVVILQGPESRWVKWPDVLCAHCNNSRTQPFDLAYDKFIEYVEDNQDEILARRQINFQSVYGSNWEVQQLNLFKYFAKNFGCKIAAADLPVPQDLVTLIGAEHFQTALWVCIAVNEDEVNKPKPDQTLLRTGNLIGNEGFLASAYFYRWLVFSFWYGKTPTGPVGGRWCADLQFISLGSYCSVDALVNYGTEESPIIWPGF